MRSTQTIHSSRTFCLGGTTTILLAVKDRWRAQKITLRVQRPCVRVHANLKKGVSVIKLVKISLTKKHFSVGFSTEISVETRWIFHGNIRGKFHGIPWYSMEVSMGDHGVPRASAEFHGKFHNFDK